MSKRWTILVVVFLFVGVGAGYFWGEHQNEKDQDQVVEKVALNATISTEQGEWIDITDYSKEDEPRQAKEKLKPVKKTKPKVKRKSVKPDTKQANSDVLKESDPEGKEVVHKNNPTLEALNNSISLVGLTMSGDMKDEVQSYQIQIDLQLFNNSEKPIKNYKGEVHIQSNNGETIFTIPISQTQGFAPGATWNVVFTQKR